MMRRNTFWLWITAGILAIVFTTILQPIWATAQVSWGYTYLTMLILGFVFLGISGTLHIIHKLYSVKVIIGVLGFSMIVLFLYLSLPWLSISLT